MYKDKYGKKKQSKMQKAMIYTQNVTSKLKKAREKVTERWIGQYLSRLPKFVQHPPHKVEHLKKVLTRTYYYLKLYTMQFDLEKLLQRSKFETQQAKSMGAVTELGYLLDELKNVQAGQVGAEQ